MTTKTVTIILDQDTGDEAIYVDGKLKYALEAMYPADVAKACGSSPVVLSHHCVEFGGKKWPRKMTKELEELCTK